MPFSDFIYVFRFWLTYLLLGLIALPLTTRIFSRFIDKGYIFSKTIGILLVCFLAWFLASFRVLPFGERTLWIVAAGVGIVNLVILFTNHPTVHLRRTFILVALEELLFFGALLFWSYVRGNQPIIEGLEKYMDFGFINAILRSPYMPPADMWLSGYTINYYYFGHFIAAALVLLSKIPPEVVYNLMIAVIFAQCLTYSFSIGLNLFYSLKKSLNFRVPPFTLFFSALLTAYLVTNAANLQTIYHLLTKGSASYWYPDATRFIVKKFGATDETIHEFPHYSFVVADLHGHVSDIPTVLLMIGFIFVLFLKIDAARHPESADSAGEGSPRAEGSPGLMGFFGRLGGLRMTTFLSPLSIFDSLLLGFLLSTAYMTNAMDGPIYFGLSGLVIFGTHVMVGKPNEKTLAKKIKASLIKTFFFFLFVGLTFVICSYPFIVNFKNFTEGITLVDFRTPLWMLGILWGFQFFVVLGFLILLFFNRLVKKENLVKAVANFFGAKIKFINPASSSTPPSPLLPTDLFILFLSLLSFGLIVFPEFFYIKDIYIHEYQRANTMFKMTYQAFIMLYIAVAYIFFRILTAIKTRGNFSFPAIFFVFITLFGIVSVGIYPHFAIKSYYGMTNYVGLDGLKYLESLYPDDYKLISALNSPDPPLPRRSASEGGPILLEAVGDSYTKYARISANTGIPTVLGWPVHEWLWRNGYPEPDKGYAIPGRRTADVQKIYESESLTETQTLLKKYQVNYVWIGQLEREKYKNLNEEKFKRTGKEVLKIGNSTLYQITTK